MGLLRYYEGQEKGLDFFDDVKAHLVAPAAVQEAQMQEVLDKTLALAALTPAMQRFNSPLGKIRTLDDLANSGFYTRSEDLLPRTNDDETWQSLLGHSNLRYDACTSGTTGKPKYMPFTGASTEHATLGFAGFFADELIALHEKGVKKPVLLGLTGAELFVTYKCIPQLANDMGMDVVHIPLGTALRNDAAAQELADYLAGNDVHGIFSLPTMIRPLEMKLRSMHNGDAAVERLKRTCCFAGLGGTEMYPVLEDYLRTMFGTVINLLASTEFLVPFGSDGRQGAQKMHLNPSYAIAGVIPMDELEKERKEIGYAPKMLLLQEAPIGTRGELALTMPAGVPWINARTDDFITVVQGNGRYSTPAIEYWARGSSILDIGGAKVYPQEFEKSMAAFDGKVTDWMIQAVKGEALGQIYDLLKVNYEGTATPEEVYLSLVANTSEFGVFASGYPLFEVEIHNSPEGSLQSARVRKMQELNGAPGPMKHKILKHLEYPDLQTVNVPYVIKI
ncbi:MAG: hypothetical protein HGA85_04345 [Nanoarchaeota archaeon]|nr:hypothetical protein [Nanoarchaeota archaeon]